MQPVMQSSNINRMTFIYVVTHVLTFKWLSVSVDDFSAIPGIANRSAFPGIFHRGGNRMYIVGVMLLCELVSDYRCGLVNSSQRSGWTSLIAVAFSTLGLPVACFVCSSSLEKSLRCDVPHDL